MIDRAGRRVMFDRIAVEYDAMRPGYSKNVIDLAVPPVSGVRGELLEIGCGSGQATRSLVDRAYQITAIDISPNLLAIARPRFAHCENVEFVQSSFEDFSPSRPAQFDVILAPSSWHWIDPTIGFPKASQLLRPGKILSLIAHISPYPRRGFDQAVQSVYEKIVPEWTITRETRTTSDTIRGHAERMEASGHFESVISREFQWTRRMSRAEYLQLLATYSDHQSLPTEQFHDLCTGIGDLIDREFGGQLEREFATHVCRGVNRR